MRKGVDMDRGIERTLTWFASDPKVLSTLKGRDAIQSHLDRL